MQKNGVEDFLRRGFTPGNELANCGDGQVLLSSSALAAVSYFRGDSRFRCECVSYDNEVVYAVLCDVVSPPQPCRGFDRTPRKISQKARCSGREAPVRSSPVVRNKEYLCARPVEDPKGLQCCNEYLVGVKLVTPVYLVALRFAF